jgi:hypothetical protein
MLRKLAAGGFGPNDATIRVRAAPMRVEAKFAVGEYDVLRGEGRHREGQDGERPRRALAAALPLRHE